MSKIDQAKHVQRGMFTLPKLGGAADCRILVSEYGGIDQVCKDFKITADLVNRYLVGQVEPPYTFLLALYWQGRRGFDQAFAESHWTHQYNSFRVAEAQEKVKQLERVLQHAVRLLEHRVDAAELLREAIDQAKLPAKPVGPLLV